MGRAMIDLTGEIFCHWEVIKKCNVTKHKNAYWICKCKCGNEKSIRGTALRAGLSRNCGCVTHDLIRETKIKRYGNKPKTSTSEYKTWSHIKARCYNQNNNKYGDYGGRGIKMCDRWVDSFETFLNDMGEKPTPDHSIERDNVDGNYEPSNCRWATWEEQCRNKRVVNKLGIPGVYWDKSRNNYRVTISIGGKSKTVGRYEELTDAVRSRKEAELKYWVKSS